MAGHGRRAFAYEHSPRRGLGEDIARYVPLCVWHRASELNPSTRLRAASCSARAIPLKQAAAACLAVGSEPAGFLAAACRADIHTSREPAWTLMPTCLKAPLWARACFARLCGELSDRAHCAWAPC